MLIRVPRLICFIFFFSVKQESLRTTLDFFRSKLIRVKCVLASLRGQKWWFEFPQILCLAATIMRLKAFQLMKTTSALLVFYRRALWVMEDAYVTKYETGLIWNSELETAQIWTYLLTKINYFLLNFIYLYRCNILYWHINNMNLNCDLKRKIQARY